jgi:glutamate N-acetyltransferase / amino-acid N-acetyltransferase
VPAIAVFYPVEPRVGQSDLRDAPGLTMTTPISPLAPAQFPDMPPVEGVKLATAAAGIRYAGRTDVLLALLDPGTAVAGVFTRSKCPSAPVDWCRAQLKRGGARALVVNSGNANAFTGKSGREATKVTAEIAAAAAHCDPKDVFLASTGVIGEPLDATKFGKVMDRLVADAALASEASGQRGHLVSARAGHSPEAGSSARAASGAWHEAAKAIMTTDTFPKGAAAMVRLGGTPVTICGIAKGAGMIAPDMATMLSFVFTDAAVAPKVLQGLLKAGVADTFNAVTIDGDTSTSDTLMAFATGAAARRGMTKITSASDPRLPAFRKAFDAVLANLAEQVARDGEGARKLVEIIVEGASSKTSARRIALSIANSPLVKTAIAGEDANWGRVVMAVGKAGERADRDKLSIWFGGIRVAHKGERDPAYDEAQVSAAMKKPEITLKVALGLGRGRDRVLTCDLTKEYVAINGDYRS